MTYEKALEKAAAEGAIRVFRLSDNTAYVYRLKDNHYEGRTLSAMDGNWELLATMAGESSWGRSDDGWYQVEGLPHTAKPIPLEAAENNPGYLQASLRQCYTCKQTKPESEFEREGGDPHRAWECNQCYNRRQSEVAAYETSSPRKGDFVDKDTFASPPPPEGTI